MLKATISIALAALLLAACGGGANPASTGNGKQAPTKKEPPAVPLEKQAPVTAAL